MNLLDTIKKICVETVKSMSPTDNIIGTVVSLNPLKIQISQKIILEEVNFMKLRSAVGTFPVTTPQGNGTCHHNLKVGSKVILSQCMGGNQFVVLGELIE